MDIPELLGVLEWVGCAGWVDPEEEEEAGRVSAPRPIARLRFRGVAAGRLLHKTGLCFKPHTSPCVSLNSAVGVFIDQFQGIWGIQQRLRPILMNRDQGHIEQFCWSNSCGRACFWTCAKVNLNIGTAIECPYKDVLYFVLQCQNKDFVNFVLNQQQVIAGLGLFMCFFHLLDTPCAAYLLCLRIHVRGVIASTSPLSDSSSFALSFWICIFKFPRRRLRRPRIVQVFSSREAYFTLRGTGLLLRHRCFLETLSSLLFFPVNSLVQQLLDRLAGPNRQ